MCHRMPERTIELAGVAMPVCSRCGGLFTGLALGAQNVSEHGSGAYTGEVAPAMLHDIGCEFVIVGHSERRALYGESSAQVAAKFAAALAAGNTVILITHQLHDIPPEVTRVILLKRGQVIAQGDKEQILTDKNLSELFETPIKLVTVNGYYQAIPATS